MRAHGVLDELAPLLRGNRHEYLAAASGKHIRDNSPHQTTFIISMSNDGLGYYPTREAFEYGCYESYTTSWARGIAEDTADKFVGLLNALK